MRGKSSDSEPLSPGSGSDVMPLTAMATPVLTAKEPLSDLFDVDNTEIHTAQGALDHFDDSAQDATMARCATCAVISAQANGH